MKQEKSIFVKFLAAERGEIISEFTTAGELKADEDVIVAAQRPGRVVSIFVNEGQYLKSGTTLIEIAGKDVDADLIKAKQDFDTYKKLFDEGAISQLELNGYKANLDKLKSFKNDLVVKAQIDGQVGEIYIDKGDYVKEGDKILDLIKLYPLELTYTIPERLLAKVKPGQSVIFTTDSYPGKEFSARVTFISPRVDALTRATLVRARVAQTNLSLKANQYVTVKQILNIDSNALLVPEEAIFLDQGQEYIYTAEAIENTKEEKEEGQAGPPPPTHIAKRNLVETGARKPGYVEILSGIKDGESVIYAGLTSIYPGAKLIQVKEEN